MGSTEFWIMDLRKHQIHHVTSEYKVEMFHDCDKSPFGLVMTAYGTLISHIGGMGHIVS